ncbi:glucuronate isomerase, partial [Thioclava sp.]|uniref:glucuronate isomerase n=1 Tax=Thioclava sp. TaxID=1933450 RepID=UPI0032426465
MALLNKDRLLPADPGVRALARDLYDTIKDAPIISPHGHTDPRWYAQNEAFPDPAQLFVTPDHYVFRMLHSQGVPLEALGVPRVDGGETETDGRKIWRLFAEHYHLFRATPSRIWLDHAFETIFGFTERLSADTADMYYDRISEALQRPEMRPRALFEQFNIEVIATTESPLDDLKWHRMIRESGWGGRVITAYRPDPVVDPDFEGFAQNVETFCQLGGPSGTSFAAYLDAHRDRRAYFASFGATSTDHGHPSAATLNLDRAAV